MIPSGAITNHDRLPSDVFDAAMTAAFPGLPQCMTLDEAGRRVAAALNAAWPLIEHRIRGRVADETGSDEDPGLADGDHGTCTCGKEITLRAERTVLMADGTDGHGHSGGRETLVWRHSDPAIDYMHSAQLGGPA